MPSRDNDLVQGRYTAVARVLIRVFVLNLGVALAKIAFGYFSGAVSVLSDGFHSLIDASRNVVGLIGIRAASQPPDEDHPYGHRKFETVAASNGFMGFILLVMLEVLRNAFNHLTGAKPLMHDLGRELRRHGGHRRRERVRHPVRDARRQTPRARC